MWALVGLLVVFAGIALFLKEGPRVLFDYLHADAFVETRDLEITKAECTSWNIAILARCKVDFESRDGQLTGTITDVKFGRAPTGDVQLLTWRDDPTVVTTDVSLEMVGSRLFFQIMVFLGGLLLLIGVAVNVMKRLQPGY
jgi:hypothetical protein